MMDVFLFCSLCQFCLISVDKHIPFLIGRVCAVMWADLAENEMLSLLRDYAGFIIWLIKEQDRVYTKPPAWEGNFSPSLRKRTISKTHEGHVSMWKKSPILQHFHNACVGQRMLIHAVCLVGDNENQHPA